MQAEMVIVDCELWTAVIYECLDRMGLELPSLEAVEHSRCESDPHVAQALTLFLACDSSQLINLYLQLVPYDDSRHYIQSYTRKTIVTLLWRLLKFGDLRSEAQLPAGLF